ncbi:MAG: winged helix-turn-helix domain-containing protein, partial [Pantoea sp.]|nr:winged helix-turn-helix domain-containing protein [Pantoea sp.]
LSLLLQKNNEQLSRNEILEKVWEQYGLVASNHNLNRNVSILRKTLQELGLSDIIETIPKQGFRLHCDFQLVAPVQENNTKKINQKVLFDTGLKLNFFIFICFSILLTCLYIKYDEKNSVLYKYKTIGKCDVYVDKSLTNINNVPVFFSTMLGKKIIETCKSMTQTIFFDDNKTSLKDKMYSTHVAVCKANNFNKGNQCENYLNIKNI